MTTNGKAIGFGLAACLMMAPVAGSAATYKAKLKELNGSGVSGAVIFDVDMAARILNVSADIAGLTPGAVHLNHIHGRFDDSGNPANSILPTADLDTDGDGFIEVLEAAPNYGNILLSLESYLSTDGPADAVFTGAHQGPFADADGNLQYDLAFDLADGSIFGNPISGTSFAADDLFPLDLREYVIHGLNVPAGVTGPDAPAGYDVTMPVAAAEIAPVPLPAGAVLLLTGLAGLGMARRRAARSA